MSQRTLNSTGNKGRFLIVDNDGKPLTSAVYNTAGLALSVILQNGTEAAITLSVAGDLLNRGKGIYEVAVPNSAYENLGDLTLCGVITDGAVVGFPQQVIAEVASASSFAKLFRWLGVIAGKSSDPATLAEIQATAGGATFDNATDSLEAADELSRSVGSPCTVERSLADENPITFSWVNSTDTVTGRVSIDNAAYVAVAGAIAYLRTDDGTAFYTLAFDAADRPSAEGTARYEFTSGGTVRYVTLRTAVASGGGGSAAIGDWAITRTFQISGGDKVSGVRMSLVGVAGKTDTTGSDGVATVKTDGGTYTLRVVVPAGYEDVADSTVVINGADSTATVTLVATTVTPPANPAKSALEILCLDETGEPEADVAVDIRIAVVPSGDQNIAYKGTKQTATSDANGVARLEAIKGAEYEYKRGKAEVWNRVTIGSGDTTSVSSFIGSP
jgi:hypothetical protein